MASPLRALIAYTLAVTFLAYEMALQVIPAIMTDHLMNHFHLSAATLGLVASAYFIPYAACQLPAGWVFDRFELKHTLTLSAWVCALGLTIFSHGHTPVTLALGRMLTGLGSAFAFVGVLMTIHGFFNARWFGVLTGITQAIAALGALVGGAPIAHAFASMGIVPTLDALALVGALLGLLMGLGLPTTEPTGHTPPSLSDLRGLLGQRQLAYLAAYAFLSWGPVTLFPALWGEAFLSAFWHINLEQAASWTALIWIGISLGAPAVGAWVRLNDANIPAMALTAALGTLGGALLVVGPLHLPTLAPALLAVGLGASGQILCFNLAKRHVAGHLTGTAMGLMNTAVVAGGIVLQPLFGLLLQLQSKTHATHYAAGDYQTAMVLVPLCFALALGLALGKLDD